MRRTLTRFLAGGAVFGLALVAYAGTMGPPYRPQWIPGQSACIDPAQTSPDAGSSWCATVLGNSCYRVAGDGTAITYRTSLLADGGATAQASDTLIPLGQVEVRCGAPVLGDGGALVCVAARSAEADGGVPLVTVSTCP